MATRKKLTPQQKIAIVREHHLEKVPVSEACDKHGISVTNFYNWQKLLFENGAGAFERKTNVANQRRQENARQQKIDRARTGTPSFRKEESRTHG